MQNISTSELRELFNAVVERVNEISTEYKGEALHIMPEGRKPHVIAEIINELVPNAYLQGSTIQQTYLYKLRQSKTSSFGISPKYHDAFHQFLSIPIKDIRLIYGRQIQNALTPQLPEFPEENPSFPASPHYQLPIPGFKKVWIKDESFNPTGTHKDRKAYELLLYLQDITKKQQDKYAAEGRRKPVTHIPVSLISMGNEAYAIQTIFRKRNHPNLRVLLDKSQEGSETDEILRKIKCDVFYHDLTQEMSSDLVKEFTHNKDGADFTTHLNEELLSKRHKFYDWLSYEILNLSPNYCFVPVGTGDLYLNLLHSNKNEIDKRNLGKEHDRRFFGHTDVLAKCHFIGASTQNPRSKADKLYTPFNSPFEPKFQNHVQDYVQSGYCGDMTRLYEIDERYLDLAKKYFDSLNIPAEYSAAAGLAIFFSMIDQIPKDATIVIVNTGRLKIEHELADREKTIHKIMRDVEALNKLGLAKPK